MRIPVQCAMAAAKTYKKAPFVIADEIVAKLTSNGMFDTIEVLSQDLSI